jgi:hypothetical protein
MGKLRPALRWNLNVCVRRRHRSAIELSKKAALNELD